MDHLTLRGTRCIVPPLPHPAAEDLVASAIVVGVATAPMRTQARFPRLSPLLVFEAAAMAAVSATTPSAGSVTAREEMWVTTPGAGLAEAPATSSAKVSIGVTGGTCGSVSGRTCSNADDCINWDGSSARTASGVRRSGEGRTTLGVESGHCGVGGGGCANCDVAGGGGGVPP